MKSQNSLYFVNPFVDFALIGGISLVCYVGLTLSFGPKASATALSLSLLLQWVINWPHFSATSYRLFRSKENIRQYSLTTWLIPLLVLMGIGFSLELPESVAPYFVKVFMIWSPYHFSAQSVGLTLIYARRAGVSVSRLTRFCISASIFGTYLLATVRAETSSERMSYHGIYYPGFGLPSWTVTAANIWFVLGAVGFGIFALRWSIKHRKLLPPIILLPAVTQCVWFLFGYQTPSFYIFVPLFHSLQYLMIAWVMQLKEKQTQQSGPIERHYVTRESLRWYAINLAGGALLFFLLPRVFSSFGYEASFALGVVIAGVQIHHFFVDGVIWKLKNPSVANPLMVNLSEFKVDQDNLKVAA